MSGVIRSPDTVDGRTGCHRTKSGAVLSLLQPKAGSPGS